MILRSTSTPILQNLAYPSPAMDLDPTRPVSMTLNRTSSEGELRLVGIGVDSKTMYKSCARSSLVIREKQRVSFPAEVDEVGDGGRLFPGGGGGGWGWEGYNGQSGNQQMEEYYERMIKLYPGDALLLANYAKFLKEVRGDNMRAEEVCEKAIEANKDDGNVLSMYGDLIWKNHKDSTRALTYFDQAVQSSPRDCCVLASYARFLWDANEHEEKEAEEGEDEDFDFHCHRAIEYPTFITAASVRKELPIFQSR